MPTHILYLVRHGSRYDYSNPARWKALSTLPPVLSTNPPLSHFGFQQAELTGHHLKKSVDNDKSNLGPETVVKCYSSLYNRVLQTARPFVSLYETPILPEPGLLEYGHHHHTLEAPEVDILQNFPEIDLSYVPLTSLYEVDWSSKTSRETGISYLRRIHRFSHRYNASLKNVETNTVDVMFSHAASSSLVAALTGETLGHVGQFAPCGVFKLTLNTKDGKGWKIDIMGSDNSHSIPSGVDVGSCTKPWGYVSTADKDYEGMWVQARVEELESPRAYHLVERDVWEGVKKGGVYIPKTYELDGFVHLMEDPGQLCGVGNLFYREPKESVWVCLEIDKGRAGGEIKYEPPMPVGDKDAKEHTGEVRRSRRSELPSAAPFMTTIN